MKSVRLLLQFYRFFVGPYVPPFLFVLQFFSCLMNLETQYTLQYNALKQYFSLTGALAMTWLCTQRKHSPQWRCLKRGCAGVPF